MKFKKLLCLLLLCCVAFAQVGIERKNIEILVAQDGNAYVKEDITITPSEESVKTFENLVERGETNFDVWKTLVPDLTQTVKSLEKPTISGIKNAVGNSYEYKVLMEYNAEGFASLKSSEGRIESWEVDVNRFEFYSSPEKKFVVPDKVFVTLAIEDTRKDRTKSSSEFFEIKPEALAKGPYLQDNKVLFFINGPILTETLSIKFKVEKPITETFGSKNLVNFFMQNPIYVAILALLALLIIVFRKQVLSLVEDTSISEEDIILPRKK